MAIFKMGAIVTEIVGSIGGTNFRRGVNNGIISNKSFGGSRNKLLLNKQLGNIGNIFRQWRALDPEIQGYWDAEALNFLFPDKFGVQKNLTGRQFYSKMNIQLLPVGESIYDPTGITSDIGIVTVGSGNIEPQFGSASFNLVDVTAPVKILVSAEVAINYLNAPTFTRRITLYEENVTESSTFIEWGNQFFAAFPYFTYNYVGRFYVETINEWGFKGPPQVVNTITNQYIPPEE